jgi:hypothetical protein
MDKLFDLNDYYNNTYYKKIFFDSKLLKNNDKYLFLKIQNFIIMESCFFTFKIKSNYILMNLIDGISDVIDEENSKLEDIKYAIIEIKDNDFHILNFDESEKILFEKFKEEDIQKYRKQ